MTRRLLLDKSLELFDAKGYVATTIDDIAASAGTTRTTFYMHFPSKAHMMRSLVTEVNEIFTGADDPPLSTVVESGDHRLIRDFLTRKADQWPSIRSYILATNQAAAVEPEIAADLEQWFEDAVTEMHKGLDAAGRFDPSTRRVRCVLAFGQLEFLSRRWIQRGWYVERETSLQILGDSWCFLLTE